MMYLECNLYDSKSVACLSTACNHLNCPLQQQVIADDWCSNKSEWKQTSVAALPETVTWIQKKGAFFCCRKNGYPAITDANLVLGRILPEFFPSIFGEDEKQPLDADSSKQALKKITDQVNEQGKASGQPDKSVEEVWHQNCNTSLMPWPCAYIIDVIGLIREPGKMGDAGSHGRHQQSLINRPLDITTNWCLQADKWDVSEIVT